MTTLRDIKKRLTNISILENVTQSMKSIASSNLSYAKSRRYANKDYYESCEDILQKLFFSYAKSKKSTNEWLDILFIKQQKSVAIGEAKHNEVKSKTLLLLVSADRGLCGAYNTFVFKKTMQRIEELGEQNVVLCPIGKKAQIFVNKNKNLAALDLHISSDFKKIEYDNLSLLANLISNKLHEEIIHKVEIVYCYNKTLLEQDVQSKSLIPMTFDSEVEDTNQKDNLVTEEVAIAQDIAEIVKKYIAFAVYNILTEASIAEFTSRLNAMSNANDNCSDLKKALHLEYNRTRQGVITKELIEIISGSESL